MSTNNYFKVMAKGLVHPAPFFFDDSNPSACAEALESAQAFAGSVAGARIALFRRPASRGPWDRWACSDWQCRTPLVGEGGLVSFGPLCEACASESTKRLAILVSNRAAA